MQKTDKEYRSVWGRRFLHLGEQILNEGKLKAPRMDPLRIQNTLEQSFPYYRERREKDEEESPMNTGHELEDDEFGEGGNSDDASLYFEIPYAGGPSGKHLNTLA